MADSGNPVFLFRRHNIRPGQVRDQKNRFRHCDGASDNRGFDLFWLMVLVVDSAGTITQTQPKSSLFLILSGGAAGASWPSLFRAILTGLLPCIVNINSRIRLRTESSCWITL